MIFNFLRIEARGYSAVP